MKKQMKLMALLTLLVMCAALTGCHGSQDSSAFAIPQSFDTGRQYEVIFWAKNDTNKIQTGIYEKAIEDFQNHLPHQPITL